MFRSLLYLWVLLCFFVHVVSPAFCVLLLLLSRLVIALMSNTLLFTCCFMFGFTSYFYLFLWLFAIQSSDCLIVFICLITNWKAAVTPICVCVCICSVSLVFVFDCQSVTSDLISRVSFSGSGNRISHLKYSKSGVGANTANLKSFKITQQPVYNFNPRTFHIVK